MMRKSVIPLLLILMMLFVAACGTIATPEPIADAEEGVTVAEADDHGEEIATEEVEATEEMVVEADAQAAEADATEEVVEVAEEPTAVPPTETPEPTDVPPTATTAPTETPVSPTATPEPTEVPPKATTEPTEEVVEVIETEEMVAEAEEVASGEADVETLIAEAIAAGDVENGQAIFNAQYDTAVGPWICASCHSVDESALRLVGPTMWDIHETAVERIAESGDPDPVTYVRNSILMPMAYIVPPDAGGPYPENLMPPNYGELLTEQELADVVAYLLTLGNE
ncbi:MAG: cytochrome c [Chloroflexota bacterium]